EDDRRLGRMLSEDAGELHDHGRAGGVVVGAGRGAGGVFLIAVDGVVVAGGDVDAVGIGRAFDGGDDVHELDGLVVRARTAVRRGLVADGDAGELRQLIEDPRARVDDLR